MISDKFSKKVSPQVAAKLLKNSKDALFASEVEVTIFFSDIRNFTTISENFDNPKILIDYLNTYMSPMSQIIIEHEGTIDKYIGDAIMAYWNAPILVQNHADKAVSAAIKQIQELKKLNRKLKQKKYPPIEIGIGIHTGNAIVGEMGSEGRSDYTAIGDSINLGSRIEGLCKPYGVKILISKQTKDKLTKKYKLREIDEVQVKGKQESVLLYEVLGFGEFSEDELEIENFYKEAKNLYKKAKFKEAYALFFKAFQLQEAKVFALYMDRCAKYEKKDIKEFDAVYKFSTK
jgi:adenylate cyclase